MEVYCEGELIRRVSLRKVAKSEANMQYKNLMREIQQVAKLSDKNYYVDLKVE
jgi:hypothetical protein